MLFERWDKGRGIHFHLPFEAHIRPTMMYLAHWIYTNDGLSAGVTEQKLITKAANYLCSRVFEDHDEAEKAAREFIEFCRGRAWVFTNTGSTTEEELYQFTHRTFLEYFAASHLVRISRTPEDLKDNLLPRIAIREWDVVAQLAFAGDELLNVLVKEASEASWEERFNLLSFAARCLEFMVPSPLVRRIITTACIEHCLVWGVSQLQDGYWSNSEPYGEAMELLKSLLSASKENRITIIRCLEEFIVEEINEGNEFESIIAIEIGFNLHVSVDNSEDLEKYLDSNYKNISATCHEKIIELCPKHFTVCLSALTQNLISLKDIIEWHGIRSVFRVHTFTIFPSVTFVSLAYWYLNMVLHLYKNSEEVRFLNHLREVASILTNYPGSWTTGSQMGLDIFDNVFEGLYKDLNAEQNGLSEFAGFNSNEIFTTFTFFAVILEALEKQEELDDFLERIKTSNLLLFDSIRLTFLAPFEPIEEDLVQAEINKCSFTSEQQAFIWQWIRGEIRLVAQISPEEIDIES
jgi:hypothetical protein